jgi:hypothetical protein
MFLLLAPQIGLGGVGTWDQRGRKIDIADLVATLVGDSRSRDFSGEKSRLFDLSVHAPLPPEWPDGAPTAGHRICDSIRQRICDGMVLHL